MANADNFVRWFRQVAPYVHDFGGRTFVVAFGVVGFNKLRTLDVELPPDTDTDFDAGARAATERGMVVGTTTVFLDLAFGVAPVVLGFIADASGKCVVEIYNNPATGFVASFVGQLNRLPATVVDGSFDTSAAFPSPSPTMMSPG